jgi:hypothetical protein
MERPEVVAQVQRYLTGELSRDELQDWLVPLIWDPAAMELDPQTDDLVNSIQLYLAEFTGGHLTEDELREYLHVLLPPTITIFVGHGAEELRYSSSPQDTHLAEATVGAENPFSITRQLSSAGR